MIWADLAQTPNHPKSTDLTPPKSLSEVHSNHSRFVLGFTFTPDRAGPTWGGGVADAWPQASFEVFGTVVSCVLVVARPKTVKRGVQESALLFEFLRLARGHDPT